jgi:hypothetical protein
MHDQPDHEGLDYNLKLRKNKNQNCNQDIADEVDSFIQSWDSDSSLDLAVGLKSGTQSCNNWLTFSVNKIQVLMMAGRRNIWEEDKDFCTFLMGQPKMTLNGTSSLQIATKNSLKYMGHKYMVLTRQIR